MTGQGKTEYADVRMRQHTFDESLSAFGRYLEREPGLERTTRAKYRRLLRCLAIDLGDSGRTLLQITSEDWTSFCRKRCYLGEAVLESLLSALCAFHGWMQIESTLITLPICSLPQLLTIGGTQSGEGPRNKEVSKSREIRAYSFLPEVLRTLLHNHDLLRSEIISIMVGDIDLASSIIHVRSAKLRIARSVTLSKKAAHVVRLYLFEERKLNSPGSPEYRAALPAFVNAQGDALTRQHFSEVLRASQLMGPAVYRPELTQLRMVDRSRIPSK